MRPSGNKQLVEALGIEMKVRREELEISQAEVAGRSGLDRPYLTLMEAGRKQPTVSVMYKVAQALELSFREFAERIEARYNAATDHS